VFSSGPATSLTAASMAERPRRRGYATAWDRSEGSLAWYTPSALLLRERVTASMPSQGRAERGVPISYCVADRPSLYWDETELRAGPRLRPLATMITVAA
jgi:hypothetical protein